MQTALQMLVSGIIGFLIGTAVQFVNRLDDDYKFEQEDIHGKAPR